MRYNSVLPAIPTLNQHFTAIMTFNAHDPPTHVALIFAKPALGVGWEGTVISHSQLLIQPPLPFAMYHYLRNGDLYIVASSSI